MKRIDSQNFDTFFEGLLKVDKAEKVIRGRFDIEDIGLNGKNNFITHLISSLGKISSLTYKILFWEKNHVIQTFIQSNKRIEFRISTKYESGKKPGVVFIDENGLDKAFFEVLLTNHFNYEMAEEPSMNIRVQLCVNYENHISIIDIYDDRGGNIYYLSFE